MNISKYNWVILQEKTIIGVYRTRDEAREQAKVIRPGAKNLRIISLLVLFKEADAELFQEIAKDPRLIMDPRIPMERIRQVSQPISEITKNKWWETPVKSSIRQRTIARIATHLSKEVQEHAIFLLEKLPCQEQWGLFWYYVQERSQTEIANELGVTQPSVNAFLRRRPANLIYIAKFPWIKEDDINEIYKDWPKDDLDTLIQMVVHHKNQVLAAKQVNRSQGWARHILVRALKVVPIGSPIYLVLTKMLDDMWEWSLRSQKIEKNRVFCVSEDFSET